MEHDLLRRRDVAHICGVGVRTLERWAKQGIGPQPLKMGPRLVRYRRGDVERWLSNCLRSAA
ncbi:helix-turn-helix transcriptional regulator [Streptosporangium sandarakinum]|uniref:helix-turn-helix transcriptional regulator n=1 Tax=Streptosporangium sandarakinum TaxID=1260955 RepID=UPI00367EC00D